jgi:hypothetical protein
VGTVVLLFAFLMLSAGALVAFAVFATDRMPDELLHELRMWRLKYTTERLESSTRRWRALGNAYSAVAEQLHDAAGPETAFEARRPAAISQLREAAPTPVVNAAQGA